MLHLKLITVRARKTSEHIEATFEQNFDILFCSDPTSKNSKNLTHLVRASVQDSKDAFETPNQRPVQIYIF